MKKILSILAGCLLCASLSAQNDSLRNGFGGAADDWFVAADLGVAGLHLPDPADRIAQGGPGAVFSLSAGRWVMPFWGVRMQLKSMFWQGAGSAAQLQSWGVDPAQVSPCSDGSARFPVWYLNPHADLMLSISACIDGGYRPSTRWDVVPFIGLGYLHAFAAKGAPAADCLTGHAGVQGVWRINDRWDLRGELSTAFMPDFYTEAVGTVRMTDVALTVGVNYNIGGHTFGQLRKRDKKAASRGGQIIDTLVVMERHYTESSAPAVAAPAVVQAERRETVMALIGFELGAEEPKQDYSLELKNVADYLAAHDGATVRIEAYCDASTGSAEVNDRLAQRRATVVRDKLVKDYGVALGRISLQPLGAATQLYDDPAQNRLVRLVVVE